MEDPGQTWTGKPEFRDKPRSDVRSNPRYNDSGADY